MLHTTHVHIHACTHMHTHTHTYTNTQCIVPGLFLPYTSSHIHTRIDSTKTKLWGLVLKLISGPSHPMLYSYQRSIPRLPVPSLDGTCKRVRSTYTGSVTLQHTHTHSTQVHTCTKMHMYTHTLIPYTVHKHAHTYTHTMHTHMFFICLLFYIQQYLETVRALLSEKDFQEMEKLVEEFKASFGIAPPPPLHLLGDRVRIRCYDITLVDGVKCLIPKSKGIITFTPNILTFTHHPLLSTRICHTHTCPHRMVLARRCNVTSFSSLGGLPTM